MTEGGGSDDRRSPRERMLAGDLYIADDPELAADARRARRLQDEFNRTEADQHDERRRILEQLLGGPGADADIRPPFYCDHGNHLRIGSRTFVNFGLRPGVSIGENTVVGAGAVVTRDLPANLVAVGNPARVARLL